MALAIIALAIMALTIMAIMEVRTLHSLLYRMYTTPSTPCSVQFLTMVPAMSIELCIVYCPVYSIQNSLQLSL